ncbi:MAG TPA: formate dehydrogenase subunit delta [Rhizomicrobium sp.]|jgi:formate dehydrogenase subunit delta|nr:formate dehydrogenase subunit delta [Rhizomicrobium sp.]
MNPDEKLAYMANQVAKFFAAQGEERAAKGVADHLQKFWNPDMRRDFLAAAAKDSSNLHPAVKAALPLLRATTSAQ